MKSYLVLCDCGEADAPAGSARGHDASHRVCTAGSDANVRIESIGPKLFENLDPLLDDLVRLAAYVYFADRMSSRGTVDVFGEKWARDLRFVVRVSSAGVWRKPTVRNSLVAALQWLMGDRIAFEFVDGAAGQPRQAVLPGGQDFTEATCVSLFSGGLDSLAGTVWDNVKNGERPLLVSHRPSPVINSRQQALAKLITGRLRGWTFPHIQAWINFRGRRDVEHTQRSRSFLYLALAVAIASQLGIPKVRVYENGVTSLNIPISGQTVGTTLTRTTHPVFIQRVGEFFDALLGSAPRIETPFLFRCKGQVAKLLEKCGHADLIEASTSCTYTRFMTKLQPGCGVCSQCIERQLALWGVGLEGCDHNYRHDLFQSSLDQVHGTAMAKAMAQGYVRTHVQTSAMTEEQFYEAYPEVAEVLSVMQGDASHIFQNLFRMYRSHSQCVRSALIRAVRRYTPDLIHKRLPDGCLLRLIGAGTHFSEPVEDLARKLSDLAANGLPRAFRTSEATCEAEVQDALDAVFASAGLDVQKEFPVVSFLHVKGSKPDFSAQQNALFVEVKYPRKTRPMSQIGSEIAADITEYGANSAAVLFIVYDPLGLIRDKPAFVRDVEKHTGVYAVVVRK